MRQEIQGVNFVALTAKPVGRAGKHGFGVIDAVDEEDGIQSGGPQAIQWAKARRVTVSTACSFARLRSLLTEPRR
jgi:hypothetical protein